MSKMMIYHEYELNELRLNNTNNIIVGCLNISSLPGKHHQLKLLTNKIDIVVLTEAKLDETFPSSRFLIDVFSSPFRLIKTELVLVF